MAPAGSPRCKVCGFAQNVDMLHLYRCCYKCRREITPASALPVSDTRIMALPLNDT